MSFDTRVLGAMLRLARYRRAADGEAVALRVGGRASSARASMRRLARAGLVDLRREQPARLTMAGLALAVAVVRSGASRADLPVDASRAA
jgi:Mn-dependent DtxR family transcriptional regulator